MKQNQIKDLPNLDVEHYENIFNVYRDTNGMYFYNLIQSIKFPTNLPEYLFTYYNVKPGDTWPYISYKTLGSPNLWWIILHANQIINPIEPISSGTILKIPVKELVKEVLFQIGN